MSRILVVDDDPAKRETAARMLHRFGHEIVEAESGDQAIHILADARGRFDIVITDFSMPGMDGVALTKCLRDIWTSGNRPTIVILSGTLPSGIPDLAFEMPVMDWTALNTMITAAEATRPKT